MESLDNALKDLNLDIAEFKGEDFKNMELNRWLYFAKANKSFHEPGISYDELKALHKACEFALRSNNEAPLIMVETGMCFGTTTRYFVIRALKYGGEVHSYETQVREPFKKAMEELGLWKYVNVHGHSIRDPWIGKPINLLLIDSEHALEDALGEYMKFRVWLTAEAVVGFHDTDICPGVKRAIEIIQEVDELELVSESSNKASAGIQFYRRVKVSRADMPWIRRKNAR